MVGRKPYVITPADYSLARRYLDRVMQRGEISTADGYMANRQAHTADALQAWCDDYLPRAVWLRLKNAVLATRKRTRDYKTVRQKKRGDLDHLAYLRLTSLAEERKLTLSETVLLLEDAYYRALDAGVLRRG